MVDELQIQGLPIELHQNVAATGIPLCVGCQRLQRQLQLAEIESEYWHNTAKVALDDELIGRSDSSVHSGGQEFNSDVCHGALRAGILDPDALMRPGGFE